MLSRIMRASDERWSELVAARVELERLTREAAEEGVTGLKAAQLQAAQEVVDKLVDHWNAALSWNRLLPPPGGSAPPGAACAKSDAGRRLVASPARLVGRQGLASRVADVPAHRPRRDRPDRKSISVLHDHEVRDWCRSLACTESELRAAIEAVGNSADRVREVLRRKGGRPGATDDVPE
jgi:hypothetical protein